MGQTWLPFEPDITARKHGGAAGSVEAYERLKPSLEGLRARVLAFLRKRGEQGGTFKEVAGALGIEAYSASGRLSELKAAGLVVELVRDGMVVRRERAAVVVVEAVS